MKVVAFNGSPRKDGNTASLIWTVFQELAERDIDVEMVQLGGKLIQPCTACGDCHRNKERRCIIQNDIVNECVASFWGLPCISET